MRYVPVRLKSAPGRGKTGWYVQDTSVRDCTVTLGIAHLLRIDVQEECDKLNSKSVLVQAQEASAQGDHVTARRLFRDLNIDYIHQEVS